MRTYKTATTVGVFVLSTAVSYNLAAGGGGYSPLWPATGAGVGMLYILGVRYWPVLLLVNLAGTLMLPGTPDVAGLFSVAVGTGSSALGVFAALQKRHDDGLFPTLPSTAWFLLLAGVVPAVLGASFGLWSLPPEARRIHTFLGWVFSDLFGVVVIAPVMIAVLGTERKRRDRISAEESLFVAVFIVTCLGVFGRTIPTELAAYPLQFVLVPFLLWAALRFGTNFFLGVLAVASVVPLAAVFLELGPFATRSFEMSIVVTQLFLVVLGALALLFHAASLEGDRRMEALAEQRRSLERMNEQLEAEIRERTWDLLRSITDIRPLGGGRVDGEPRRSSFLAFRLSENGDLLRVSAGLAQALGYQSAGALMEMESMIPGGFAIGRMEKGRLMEAIRRETVVRGWTTEFSGRDGVSKRLPVTVRGFNAPDGVPIFYEGVFPDPRVFGVGRGDVFDEKTGLPDLRYLDGAWIDGEYFPSRGDADCTLCVLRISPIPLQDAAFRRCVERVSCGVLRSLDPIVRGEDGELVTLLFGVGGPRGGRAVMSAFRERLLSCLPSSPDAPDVSFCVSGVSREMTLLQMLRAVRCDPEYPATVSA